jgi:hypothetical protein
MQFDYSDALRFLRPGTPGYLLLAAGLFHLERRPDDGYELAATEMLASWFPAGLPDLEPVAAALESLAVSMAYDRSGFLDGSTLAIRAVSDLRGLGVPTTVYVRGPLEQAAGAVTAEMERAKRMVR